MWKVQLFKLNFDQRERDAALSVIDRRIGYRSIIGIDPGGAFTACVAGGELSVP